MSQAISSNIWSWQFKSQNPKLTLPTDCLMLNFTIKLISDAGYQGEITSISTAAQQVCVFVKTEPTENPKSDYND